MSQATQTDHFQKLPLEILITIFQYVDDPYLILKLRALSHSSCAAGNLVYPNGYLEKRLPIALWERVFSHVSSYKTLTRVARTCKSFRKLLQQTEAPSLNRRIFRGAYSPGGCIDEIKFHPAFRKVFRYLDNPRSQLYVKFPRRIILRKQITLDRKNPMLEENATYPPVNKALIEWGGFSYFPIVPVLITGKTERSPVTVGDVFWACEKLLRTPMNEDQAEKYKSSSFSGKWYEYVTPKKTNRLLQPITDLPKPIRFR